MNVTSDEMVTKYVHVNVCYLNIYLSQSFPPESSRNPSNITALQGIETPQISQHSNITAWNEMVTKYVHLYIYIYAYTSPTKSPRKVVTTDIACSCCRTPNSRIYMHIYILIYIYAILLHNCWGLTLGQCPLIH